jgi:peptidoglycan/LPS O-acetylase OafA/YrhL
MGPGDDHAAAGGGVKIPPKEATMLKATITRIACILFGLAAGVSASYLLVVKGLKLPAGILGIFALACLFYAYRNSGFNYETGGDAYYLGVRRK